MRFFGPYPYRVRDFAETCAVLVVLALVGIPWWALVPFGVIALGPWPFMWWLEWKRARA